MPQTEKKVFAVTALQYERLVIPPLALPSQEELFDYEIETLVRIGLARYADADPFRNRVPEKGLFLLVPPPPQKLDLEDLMAKIELNGSAGVNHLEADRDPGEFPTTASLLTDVEDGRVRLNIEPRVSRKNIENECRYPYGIWRGIIHVAMFPWVLNHHYLDLVGSRLFKDSYPRLFRSGDDRIYGGPVLRVSLGGGHISSLCSDDRIDGGRPALRVSWGGGCANPLWGAPSAGNVSVIVP